MGDNNLNRNNPGASEEAISSTPFDAIVEAARILAGLDRPWFVVGGWAVDLFLGAQVRQHKDVDIGLFRQDQLRLQEYLAGWQLFIAEGGKLTPWQQGQYLPLPTHGIWAWEPHKEAGIDRQPDLELLLNEREGSDWVYRRDPTIRRPLTLAILAANSGLFYLAPEIVLLFKAKGTRPEDQIDFEAVAGAMEGEQGEWLRKALIKAHPRHVWIDLL